MKWQLIVKTPANYPSKGTYKDWKSLLADEGGHRCVYCSISESHFGGFRNFHVEHYKPKGDKRFAHLENDYSNLFYACAICNSFKSDDWPNDPTLDFCTDAYPDPSKVNYTDLFEVDYHSGVVNGKNVCGRYIIYKLFLNRPQLIMDRKEQIIEDKYRKINALLNGQIDYLFRIAGTNIEALSLLKEVQCLLREVEGIFHCKDEIVPYRPEQIKK